MHLVGYNYNKVRVCVCVCDCLSVSLCFWGQVMYNNISVVNSVHFLKSWVQKWHFASYEDDHGKCRKTFVCITMVAVMASFKIPFDQNPGGMLLPSQGFVTNLRGCQNELKFCVVFFSLSCVRERYLTKNSTPEKFIHKFYYHVPIFIEWYFSNFRPVTCFSVTIPDAV